MRSITARLTRLEAARPRLFADVLSLIAHHAYYDEITPKERTRYCEYIGIEQKVFEDVNQMVLGDQHIMLTKFDVPSSAELEAIINEVQQEVFKNNYTKGQIYG